jgi:ethanolamine ammonia-lyase small subunit
MSVTRALVARLRERLGQARPLPPAPPLPPIAAPPARVFPAPRRRDPRAEAAARHTTALVGIGHVGTRYATDVVLQFQAELAVAHEAVAAVLPDGWPEAQGLMPLSSRVRDHHEYLLRPDLGRRLDTESLARILERADKNVDVQPILADGLSAVACVGSGTTLLEAFTRECQARGWRVGTPMAARFARVWLADEIGEAVGARVAVIMLGERPGLGTGDGLSAYMVYEPRVGKTDGERNMISNIHARGIAPAQAARRLAMLAGAMLEQRTSGVALDLSTLKDELGDAAGTGYRAPRERERLVEVPR